MSDFANEARAQLPEPGNDPISHLRHTLAVYAGQPDEEVVQTATYNVYGDGVTTGITMGDLRQIADWLEKSEEHLAPRHPVFGRE